LEPTTKEETEQVLANNRLIAEFLGYEKVRVGYFNDLDPEDGQTEWQVQNEKWMERMGMENVGNYYVNVLHDKWFECEDAAYHTDWNKLMEAWDLCRAKVWAKYMDYPSEYFKLQEKYANKCIYPDVKEAYETLVEAIKWFNSTK
jgi:hypothetical protein